MRKRLPHNTNGFHECYGYFIAALFCLFVNSGGVFRDLIFYNSLGLHFWMNAFEPKAFSVSEVYFCKLDIAISIIKD